jgi:hypothetical protein
VNITRQEAIRTGLKRYQADRPCINGHPLDRYASTGACVGCIAQGKARYTGKLLAQAGGRDRLDCPVRADAAQALRWFASETMALTMRTDVASILDAIRGIHEASGGQRSPQREVDAPMTPERALVNERMAAEIRGMTVEQLRAERQQMRDDEALCFKRWEAQRKWEASQ